MIDARPAYDAAERAARESYGKLLAYLAKRCGGIEPAQEALADAFATALERWPRDGVPDAPEAWLLVAARRRFVDRARRNARFERLRAQIAFAAQEAQNDFERVSDFGDARLELMFACAHPAITPSVRAPLILQVALGIDAERIASAFLVAPAAMSQRLVRAKQKISEAGIPLRIPSPEDLPQRLDSVLSAIYAAYVGGYDDPVGSDPRTRGLAIEAIWLGRMLVEMCPNEPEASGLLALMLYANSRVAARRDARGCFVPLEEQDVKIWDLAAIVEAESLLRRAAKAERVGRFQLEAAIQSAHAVRLYRRTPNWEAILALYDALLERIASPVVALNRAVALAAVRGPRAGLEVLDELSSDVRLRSYQPYWAARADLAARAGDCEHARTAYERALGLTVDTSLRQYLASRLEAVSPQGD